MDGVWDVVVLKGETRKWKSLKPYDIKNLQKVLNKRMKIVKDQM